MRFHNEPNTPTSANASCNLGRRTRNSNIARALVIGIWITISLLLGQSVNAAPAGKTWVSFSGDWDGDGIQTPGLYNRATSTFFLYAANAAGGASSIIQFGQARWWPVTGDWNGDGIDTIGVYNPDKGRFFLRMENASTLGQINFRFGTRRSHPISGDWDGDGVDTVGVYNRYVAVAELQATLGKGQASAKFQFGQAGWLPISGDWDGNGVDSLGVVNPTTGRFFLRNAHSTGPSDFQPLIKPTAEGSWPLVGRWDGTDQAGGDGIGIFQADGLRVSIRSALSSGAADATFELSTELAKPTAPPPPPAEQPSPPTQVTAAAMGETAVRLDWVAPSSGPVAGFRIYRNGNPTSIATTTETRFTDSGLMPGTLYRYEVTTLDSATPPNESARTSPVSAQTVAAPTWASGDIGAVSAAGSLSETGGTITLKGSGADIWSAADEFYYASQNLTGNGEIVAKVTSFTNTHEWAKAGVMIRDDLSPDSAHAMMVLTGGNGAAFQWRPSAGSATSHIAGPAFAAPAWVRLVRSGDLLSGYASDDGASWVSVGSATIPMSDTVQIGLALTSHSDGTIATAEFQSVSLGSGTGPSPDSIIPTAPSSLIASASASNRVQVAWSDRSGNEAAFELQRSISTNNGAFGTIATLGANAQAYADTNVSEGMQFCYRVRARNSAGASAFSNTQCATTPLANRPPTAKNDSFTVSQDSSGNLLAVLANDTDPDSGDTLKIVAASADRGAVSISGSKLSYSPGAGFAGSATINYTVADLAGARSTATAAVTVTATPAPDAKPSANPDSATTERDVAVTISVLANDTGLADGPISVSLVQPPSSGSASITSGGAIVYQPSGGFVGGDTLSYRVMDKDGDSAVSTVSVDVKCTACPPAQSNLTLSWDPSSGQVEGYRVYYGPTPETSILEISDLNQASGDLDLLAPSKRYRVEEDLGLKAGEQGCFRVRAYNIYGVSEYSDSACAQL